jgi:hypothetical protein
MNNCFTVSLTDMYALPVNSVDNEIRTPEISPLKAVKDELPMAKSTNTIEGEVDMRRKVSSVTILLTPFLKINSSSAGQEILFLWNVKF